MSDKEKVKRICNGKLIFRRYRTDKRTGKTLDSYHYGIRAWPICLGDWVAKEKTV